jgi:hypothetical protein
MIAGACGEAPTGTAAGNQALMLKKGGGKPPPAEQDIPVELHGFVGGVSSYGDRNLPADVKTDGRLWMVMEPGRRDPDPLRLCVDLPAPTAVLSSSDLDDFVAAGAVIGAENCFTSITLHTRDESVAGGLYSQEPGTSLLAGGKIVLKDLASSRKNSWEWRLLFDTGGGNPDQSQAGRGVCVDRHDVDNWTVRNGCDVGGVVADDMIELWRVSGAWTHVADFQIPFRLEATRAQ